MNCKGLAVGIIQKGKKKEIYIKMNEKQFLGLLDALSGKEEMSADYYRKISYLYFTHLEKSEKR